jgi:hypothetical protein
MSQKLRVPTASVKEKRLKKEPGPFSGPLSFGRL